MPATSATARTRSAARLLRHSPNSLKTMDYGTFVATVSGGRTVNRAGTTYVMPSFGSDRNIMCYIDDIYTYIKARSTDAMPPGRPSGREDVAPETQKAANDCTG